MSCEGLIGGESCPREVGQRTLSRTRGWERIWVGEELINGVPRPGAGESVWDAMQSLPGAAPCGQFVKVHWRGAAQFKAYKIQVSSL